MRRPILSAQSNIPLVIQSADHYNFPHPSSIASNQTVRVHGIPSLRKPSQTRGALWEQRFSADSLIL